jgi:hypothetical protein
MKRTITIVATALAATGVLAGTAAAAVSPTVKTEAAASIKETSAVLHASVNPQGSNTSYQFQYGLTNAYGASTALKSAGHGSKSVEVKDVVASLIPGTPYHFRIVATNAGGTSVGDDHVFTTAGHPPAVATTGPATLVGKNSATLTGTINPNGEATSWAFQYGLTTSYGLQTSGGVLPALTTPQTVAIQVPGLASATWFHYRLVAYHGATPSIGADAAFFTMPSPAPVPKVRRFTSPLKDRKRPYKFTTHGSLTVPRSIPKQFACVGNVQVRYFLGHKQVLGDVTPLSPTCGYSSTVSFRHFQGTRKQRHVKTQKLVVVVHWSGNGYLAKANSSARTVTLG